MTRSEARTTYGEVLRVLKPGGRFALDTANARLQQDDFVSRSEFSETAIAHNCGLFDEIEDCYVLAYVCRKPDPSPARVRKR